MFAVTSTVVQVEWKWLGSGVISVCMPDLDVVAYKPSGRHVHQAE
jgi:hypothetical protein